MTGYTVHFLPDDVRVSVEEGATIDEAARAAGVYANSICGGEGLCGKCRVIVTSGAIRTTATALLERDEIRAGYVLACQATIHGDVTITVPPETQLGGRPQLDR